MSLSKPIHIFRAGTHTAMSGQVLAFTEHDLAASARAYDPAVHEAPLVVGHPAQDAPAYGWVKSLSFTESGLQAQPDQLDPAFAELVSAGRYKKISASFYHPESSNNPVPGVYYLRHVGFLGALPPAVKGLKQVAFSENGCFTIECSEYDDQQVASLFRNIREWIIGKFSQEEADQIIPQYAVQQLEQSAAEELAKEQTDMDGTDAILPTTSFFESGDSMAATTEAISADELAALKAENAALKQRQLEFAEQQKRDKSSAIHAEHVSFCENLIKQGRLLPAKKELTIAALDYLAAAEDVVNFTEGDSQKPLVDAVKHDLLAQLPKIVEFGEVGNGQVADAVNFSDPHALVAAATQYQHAQAALGIVIDDIAAIQHVSKGAAQ